ncbi:unnamed protein product [Saccharomyces cerevisiae]|nr:unnamed protein product [Saccharomyces cerevisiae]
MFNRFNKLQAALALVLYSQSALGQYYTNSSSIASNSSTAVSSTSSGSVSISSSIVESTSSASDVSSSLTELTSSSTEVSSTIAPSTSSSEVSSSITSSGSVSSSSSVTESGSSVSGSSTSITSGSSSATESGSSVSGSTSATASGSSASGSTSATESGSSVSGSSTSITSGSASSVPSSSGSITESGSSSSASESSITQSGTTSGSSASSTSGSVTQSGSSVSGSSASSAPGISSSIPQSTSSASTASGSITSGTLSSITSSASSATATASNSLSSSDGTIYLPSTTISGDITLTGSVIATEAVEVAAGGKLTLLDGDKYVFSADFIIHGGVFVEKSKPTYPGTEFDISGENFDVSGTFNAEEPAASSASAYSFTPGSFDNSGDISLSLSESTKGQVTFSPYSNSGAFSFSNAILNGGSVSGLQRRAESGSVNKGEINLENGSTYVVVEPVSGSGTINIISGNLYLHYPDTFTGQTVVFKGEGVLAVDPTESNTTPIPVVGYTGENQIAITADVTALSYDSATGVLTATQGNSQFSFSIGTGFSSSGFNVSEGTFAGAYAYYLNYGGVVASSATPSSASTTSGVVSTATGSVTLSSNASTTVSSTISSSAPDSIIPSSSASISGVSNSTTASASPQVPLLSTLLH